ncbi:hypothetical protein M5K25_003662 [Dendrobium thyrsiflorum]|uniref:Uncharacterized protein n=1 Tax=Dendrobium thyrsiflorum TaxID=117978 RepID=A0ABD0VS28_DENTH
MEVESGRKRSGVCFGFYLRIGDRHNDEYSTERRYQDVWREQRLDRGGQQEIWENTRLLRDLRVRKSEGAKARSRWSAGNLGKYATAVGFAGSTIRGLQDFGRKSGIRSSSSRSYRHV